jgi:hypothetical protein
MILNDNNLKISRSSIGLKGAERMKISIFPLSDLVCYLIVREEW